MLKAQSVQLLDVLRHVRDESADLTEILKLADLLGSRRPDVTVILIAADLDREDLNRRTVHEHPEFAVRRLDHFEVHQIDQAFAPLLWRRRILG